ncbi:MAG: hypothetical protein O2946_11745 [Planctomycetota bacterium]|nr:hypothetical protein [Planctomycetota bacterium]
MKEQVAGTFGFVKTTVIGGLIFLLPLAVLGGLLGYVYNVVLVIYEPLKAHLPVRSAIGISILFLVAVGILLLLCFVCGLAAQRAIGRTFSRTIEKQLVMVFPKYAIYKDIVAGNIGGDALAPSLVPVTVRFNDAIRIGYEAGRTARGLVIVYLPGAPDPWIGEVVLVEADRIQSLDVSFNETAAICERLGRESTQLLAAVRAESSSTVEVSDNPST